MTGSSFLEKTVLCMEKHFKTFLIALFCCAFAIPVLVFLVYVLISIDFQNPISADGLLGYIGALFGSLSTLLVSFIALVEAKENRALKNEDTQVKRRSEIRPEIEVEFTKKPDSSFFILKIKNVSNVHARRLHIYDTFLSPALPSNEEQTFTISFDSDNRADSVERIVCVDFFFADTQYADHPKYLSFTLYDIDNNCIFYDFVIDNEGNYVPEYGPYYS